MGYRGAEITPRSAEKQETRSRAFLSRRGHPRSTFAGRTLQELNELAAGLTVDQVELAARVSATPCES